MTATTWAPPTGKPATHPITVGAIFVNSWGYDQTNVDAYQVVAVTRATVKVRRIATEAWDATSHDSNRVRPVPYEFLTDWRDGQWTKHPKSYGPEASPTWYLKMDHGWCGLWDGVSDYHCSWGH